MPTASAAIASTRAVVSLLEAVAVSGVLVEAADGVLGLVSWRTGVG